MAFGLEEGVQLIVGLAAVASAIYAGKSARTAEKSLTKENKELISLAQDLKGQNEILTGQNDILKKNLEVQIKDLAIKYNPHMVYQRTLLLNPQRRISFIFQNYGGDSLLPKVITNHSGVKVVSVKPKNDLPSEVVKTGEQVEVNLSFYDNVRLPENELEIQMWARPCHIEGTVYSEFSFDKSNNSLKIKK